MSDYATARRNMVDGQLRTFDVSDRAILAAMEEIRRELFVPRGREALAYLDLNLPVPGDDPSDPRVILAPMVLARLLQALGIEEGTRVLDVADAFGYSAAVLSRLGARVTMLESRADLAEEGARRLAGSDRHPACESGPLGEGAAAGGPFDAILINGAVEDTPHKLLGQLADGGRLACLRMSGRSGTAVLFVRAGQGFGSRALFDAAAPVLAAFRPAPAFTF